MSKPINKLSVLAGLAGLAGFAYGWLVTPFAFAQASGIKTWNWTRWGLSIPTPIRGFLTLISSAIGLAVGLIAMFSPLLYIIAYPTAIKNLDSDLSSVLKTPFIKARKLLNAFSSIIRSSLGMKNFHGLYPYTSIIFPVTHPIVSINKEEPSSKPASLCSTGLITLCVNVKPAEDVVDTNNSTNSDVAAKLDMKTVSSAVQEGDAKTMAVVSSPAWLASDVKDAPATACNAADLGDANPNSVVVRQSGKLDLGLPQTPEFNAQPTIDFTDPEVQSNKGQNNQRFRYI